MSDATVSTAAGVASFPFLAAMGIDPQSMVAGLIGCIIVQTLMPSEGQSVKSIVFLTLGSVLFASLSAPVITPWFLGKLAEYPIPPIAARAAIAACCGAFAQPVVIGFRKVILPAIIRKAKAVFEPKEKT